MTTVTYRLTTRDKESDEVIEFFTRKIAIEFLERLVAVLSHCESTDVVSDITIDGEEWSPWHRR